ncbi:hypothetical protein [Bdellovibrio sp. NC01]|uniref:hypothetical protein n=1 Tax=Bdellovibrio sp. NC01 TaxID=2220073 RepID=UPI0011572C88|nr:hypothetical protein [Bdellovibrio sp. NC01]QDK38995.1 hypothetical protein DOE51_16075 [Bdellovibrio sp. NC01]
MEKESVPLKEDLPAFTYWAPFLVLAISKVISFHYLSYGHLQVLYLPYLISMPMYFWWGSRVFPQHVLAEMATGSMTGLNDWMVILFYALANASKVYMGYLIYRQIAGTKVALKSLQGFLKFFAWGVLIQNLVGNFLFLSAYVQTGAYGSAMFWRQYLIITAIDCVEAMIIIYGILVFATPFLRERGLARTDFFINPTEVD